MRNRKKLETSEDNSIGCCARIIAGKLSPGGEERRILHTEDVCGQAL
jgi:hypothetical protein